ncbi:hypothetical protein QTP70_022893, partial [Hemibagrus guttatus]
MQFAVVCGVFCVYNFRLLLRLDDVSALDCCLIVSCLCSKMRERYSIHGSCCDDFCTVSCCYRCAWCQ